MIETALLANWISLTLLWLISLRIKDSSIIDIYWGFGFVLIFGFAYSLTKMMVLLFQ